MEFALTEEQLAVKAMARDFAEREARPFVREWDRQESIPRDFIRRMGQLGLTGGVIPPKYGGAGLDWVTIVAIDEELSRVYNMLGSFAGLPSGLVGSGVLQYGTEEQKMKYLAPFARAEMWAAAAVTEPRSGSDVAGMVTSVRKDGDDYVINGSKMWISFLDHADWFITFGQMDPSKGRRGICAFVIERNWPGVGMHIFKNKVGLKALATGEISLQDVRVPKENRVAEEGEGLRVALCAVENGRISVAANCCGVMQACIEECVNYGRERIVFGQPIARYQLIQSKITDMVVGLETARLLVYRAAWLKDQGNIRTRRESSIAKMHATDTLMHIATHAVQIHGAYGVSDEYNVGRYFRDAKFAQMVEGTSEIHRILIAEYALGYRKD